MSVNGSEHAEAPEIGDDQAQAETLPEADETPTPEEKNEEAPRAEQAEEPQAEEPQSIDVGLPEDEGVPTPSSELLGLRDQVATLEARLRTVSAAYKELQDDAANTRERLERQAQAKEELRRGEVVSALFEPFQNIRRSIEAIQGGAQGDEATRGLEMIEHQALEAFNNLGLEEVPGKGAKFDPNLHEAISVIPVTDPALDDVVVEVFSGGYRIGSRLVQPARVVIGKLQESAGEA